MEEFLPLRLGCSDVILAMKWLETLGTTQTNWKEQSMTFEVVENPICLRGGPFSREIAHLLKSHGKGVKEKGTWDMD